MKIKVDNAKPEMAEDMIRMAALDQFQPWAARAIRAIADVLPGKRRNYNKEGLDPYDNFETVAAIKALLYRGLPPRELTAADAILDQILHKVVRIVRGAEWDEQVGEGVESTSVDLHGYAALLHGYFIRRATLTPRPQDSYWPDGGNIPPRADDDVALTADEAAARRRTGFKPLGNEAE